MTVADLPALTAPAALVMLTASLSVLAEADPAELHGEASTLAGARSVFAALDQRLPRYPHGPSGVIPPLDPSLPVPVAMVVAGLQALERSNPADLPPDTALLVTQVLLNAHDRTKALALAAVSDVQRRQLHALDDSPSTATWVAEQATSFNRSDVALAGKLDRIPQVAARIAEGGLSVDDGIRIGKALDKLRPHLDRPDGLIDGQPAEQALYGVIVLGVCDCVGESRGGLADTDPRLQALHAELLEVLTAPLPELTRLETAFLILARAVARGQLQRALGRLVDALLPNQLDRDAAEDDQNRNAWARKCDGPGWDLGGHLDDETGELFATALAAQMATDPDNPLDTEQAEALRAQGLDPYADGCVLVRTLGQRRHDALKLILRKVLGANVLGTRGKAPVTVNVTVSSDALHGVPGALPATGSSGQSLPISLARRLACEGSAFTRFVLSLGHRVLESSHTARTLKPHERKVKQVETGGICQAAGCSKTGTVPHHVVPWASSNSTSLSDTALLCDSTHHDVHHGRTIRLKDGRRFDHNGWIE